ncbi:hypothetical protein F5Y08DRAFT_320535 [Xylaria arbuscula]|nr:hypothetical protein F5Y08DRAFT_320535 [Xylaria arbuscula]
MSQLISVGNAGAKGRGTFAKSLIRSGTLLTDEPPLLKIPYEHPNSIRYNLRVLESFSQLTDNDKATFLALSMNSGEFTKIRGFFLVNHINMTERDVAICAIFNTNAVRMGHDSNANIGSGVFLKHCRMNHSCAPNASYAVHGASGHMRVRAHRDIAAAEEVLVSYTGDLIQSKQERRKDFNFDCKCHICTAVDVASSDARRQRINAIMHGTKIFMCRQSRLITTIRAAGGNTALWLDQMLHGAVADGAIVPTNANEALTLTKERLSLLGRESITGPELILVWGMLALVYRLLGDNEKSFKAMLMQDMHGVKCQGRE